MPLNRLLHSTTLLIVSILLSLASATDNVLESSLSEMTGNDHVRFLDNISATHHQYLRATALVTNAKNHSVLQCWEFSTPFSSSGTPGTSGALALQVANTTAVTYTVIPGNFNGGLHEAPAAQFVVFLSGLANITLPHSPAFAEVRGGEDGLIVAADTRGDGHITNYPSDKETVALQLPFKDGRIPKHRVLNDKDACPKGSQVITA